VKKILSIILLIICGIFIFYLQFNYERKYQPQTYYQVYLDNEIIGTIKSREEFDEYVSKQGDLIRNQVQEYKEDLEVLQEVDAIIESKISSSNKKTKYLNYRKNYLELSSYVKTDGSFDKTDNEIVLNIISKFDIEDTEALIINDGYISNYSFFLEKVDAYLLEQKNSYLKYIEENQSKIKLSESEKYYFDLYKDSDLKDIKYVKQVYMTQYVNDNKIYLHTNDIYTPLGVSIQKINTYSANLNNVEEVYKYIVSKKSCTVEGYQFRIKKSAAQRLSLYAPVGTVMLDDYNKIASVNSEDVIVYVTDPKVFEEAVEQLEYVFVDAELLDAYKADKQAEIETTGSKILDVYVEEEITIKETNISVSENIYNNADELSSYLLYGENEERKKIKVSANDTISTVAVEQGISIEEFFLSNPEFTSINNIFYENQEVVIAKIDPKINIAVEQYVVEDMVVDYDVVEEYDNTMTQGMEFVKQKGENGVERVGQNIRRVNGSITYVQPVSNKTIKSPKNKIIAIGTKIIPNVGSLSNWGWPTNKGYRISSYWGWRTSPIYGGREWHSGIDIAGTGKGSPVYATNNGTIILREYVYSYGNYIIINHNNGYYSLYAHMNGFAKGLKVGSTVSRGQVIGYVGSTGLSTGPHLHFEIRNCERYSCNQNPLIYLRK
jgi:murein DD-endopeptidase MepM/ murein hydrolase activator NlpD